MAKAPARIIQQTPHSVVGSREQKAAGPHGSEPSTEGAAALRDRKPLPTPRTGTPCHSKPEPMPPLKNDRPPFKNMKG